MSSANGPKLAGIGRTSDSDLVLCMDAHDAGSYGGEATTNLFLAPTLWPLSVGATWSGSNGTWGTSTATVESVMGPDGKYIKAIANQHTASGGGTAHIWFFYQYFMGTSLRNLTLTNGTVYTCSWWWKAVNSRSASSNSIYFTGAQNYSTSHVNPVTTEWTRVFCDFTFGGITGTYNPGHYFYSCGDDFKVWYAMLQIEEKAYSTPAVRSQLSGFAQQGYNARPTATNLMIHGNVGTGTSFYDSSPSRHTITSPSGAGNAPTHTNTKSKFAGGSFHFDSSDHLIIPDSTDFDFGTGDFTIDFWANVDSGAIQDDTFFSNLPSGGSPPGMSFSIRQTEPFSLGVYSSSGYIGGGSSGQNYTNRVIYTGIWYHIALVRMAGVFYTFVNGAHVGTDARYTSLNLDSPHDFYLGRFYTNVSAYYLNAYMDEFRVTKGTALWRGTNAFTPPERRSNDGPVLDLSGSNKSSNLFTTDMTDVKTNRRGQVIEPIASAVWDFDGTDDYMRGAQPTGQVGSTTAKTYEYWFKTQSFPPQLGMLTMAGNDANNYKWQYVYVAANGYLQFLYGNNSNYNIYGGSAQQVVGAANVWTCVAISIDISRAYDDRLKIYKNGEPISVSWNTGGSYPRTDFYDGTDLRLYTGVFNHGSSSSFFQGEIGKISVWKTGLSHDQVKQNFNNFRGRFGV